MPTLPPRVQVAPHGSTAFWEAAFADGSIANYSIAIESDGGVFEPAGIGANANRAATEILRSIAAEIGFEVHSTQRAGGSDVNEGLRWGGVPVGSLVSHEVAAFELANSVNAGVLPAPGHFQGDYFFYHHSEGDTMEVLDSGQLDRAASMWTQWAFAIANLPTLLPRVDTGPMRERCAREECPAAANVTCMTSCLGESTRALVEAEHVNGEVFPPPQPEPDAPGSCNGTDAGGAAAADAGGSASGGGSTAGGVLIGLLVGAVGVALLLVLVSMRGSLRLSLFGLGFSLGKTGDGEPEYQLGLVDGDADFEYEY